MKDFIKKNAISFLAGLVLALIILSSVVVIYNRKVMINTTQQVELSEKTLIQASNILNNLQAIDLGLRAYAITSDENHLGHYTSAVDTTPEAFSSLEVLLNKQNYPLQEFLKLQVAMQNYSKFCDQIIVAIEQGNSEKVKEMIAMDKGFVAWSEYQKFYKNLEVFEKSLSTKAQQDYSRASISSIWIILILLLVSIPTISLIVFLLRKGDKKRKQLFKELEINNHKYNFNPGIEREIVNEYEFVESFIETSKKASNFVNKITIGQYDVEWEGLNEKNQELNEENLAGALLKMRDQMITVKKEEDRRLWVTKGLAEFSELIRKNQNDLKSLTYETVVFLVKYLKAQQGGLFLVTEDESSTKQLELNACYAFERRKFIMKKIEVGEGLIGQAYLEGETIYLIDIPEGYTEIKSGLGDASPNCLLVVPMKYNDEVQAVMEIASFIPYEPYQIEFLEKVGEFIASAVSTVQVNEITQKLLIDAQQMAEEMKAQEEEMRQNMEELSATQEEMHRKEQEYIKRIEDLERELKAKIKNPKEVGHKEEE